jgi:perosamine synthetase
MSLHGISSDAWKRFSAAGSWYYEIVAPGFKYNLTDIASALGLHQLRRADAMRDRRAWVATRYQELLQSEDGLVLPQSDANRLHSWHLYAIRLRLDRLTVDRAAVMEQLKAAGVGASVHWIPLHLHPYYRATYGYQPQDYPVAAKLSSEIISLPIFPGMTEEEIQYVVKTLAGILGSHRR